MFSTQDPSSQKEIKVSSRRNWSREEGAEDTVLIVRNMRPSRLLGLRSNAGHPESVVKSGTAGKELGNGADKWQPWLAAHLEAPELRL